jgi:5-hydroxyisourate hydrolase
MSAITTHVLDVVLGKPAAGIEVRLEKQEGGGWIEVTHSTGEGASWTERVEDAPGAWSEIARATTDADGRCRDLAANAGAGVYRLRFGTESYLRRSGRTSIFPEVVTTFRCSGDGHYHLPVLLSDNSYTTYRGS